MSIVRQFLFFLFPILFLFSCSNCDNDHLTVCKDVEICDGIDNDCNGIIDDAFDNDKDNFTICQNDCDDTNRFVNPNITETCNNIDDNCNSVIDENIIKECWDGLSTADFSDQSQCKKGTRECLNGVFTECLGQVFPSENEICDGIDNNCNGKTDEIEYGVCGPDVDTGVCFKGNQVCFGDETICLDAVFASDEICDGLDNNCNSKTDEDLKQGCETLCGIGQETCSSGNWINCDAPMPIEEVCDGIDNDCDGEADEGCQCVPGMVKVCKEMNMINPVDNSTISCGIGVQVCTMISKTQFDWGQCVFVGIEPESCNSFDDDCDEVIDGFTAACGELLLDGIGECKAGSALCEFGNWGECIGSVNPKDEICDLLDNDCDLLVDEGLNPHDVVDIMFGIDGSGSMQDKIQALKTGISTYVNEFQGTEHRFGLVIFPGTFPNTPALLRTPLTDITTFQNSLNGISANFGGQEPSYDVVELLARSTDPLGINWRSEAYPYIILVADEHAQTWTGRDVQTLESEIATKTSNCSVGSCVPGDRFEIYIISAPQFYQMWNEIIFNEADRYFNIDPANTSHYYDVLYNIFSNLCRN